MRFKLFSDAELRNKSVDALKRRLRSKRAGYHLAFKDIKVGNLLYRGVPLHDWPSKIDEVSYPPADKAKLNRANRAGVTAPVLSLVGGESDPAFFEIEELLRELFPHLETTEVMRCRSEASLAFNDRVFLYPGGISPRLSGLISA
jgi:hypothetical protein